MKLVARGKRQTASATFSRIAPGSKLSHHLEEPSMTTLVEEPFQQARALSTQDRVPQAEDLLASLDSAIEHEPASEAAWKRARN